jgi:hypothetical protein
MTELKTLDLSIFPIKRTIFEILKEEGADRQTRMDKEINSWKTSFPSAGKAISDIDKKNKPMVITSSIKSCLAYFNTYNHENDILGVDKEGKIKESGGVITDALKQVAELFKVGEADTEPLIKLLKEIANDQDQQELLKDNFQDIKGGVAWVVFVLDTFKNFYLDKLPSYVNEKLAIAEPVKLEEVKDKLKPILTDIFTNCCAGFDKVEQENDLDQFKAGVNKDIDDLNALITKTRNDKKKNEPKPAEKPADYDKTRADLEKWTKAFPNSDPDFNKDPKAIEEEYKRLKGNQKPVDPADELKDLGLDNDQPESLAKKKLIIEIRRVAKLKGISVKFTNDKTKLIPASKTDINLLLDQKDTSGQFNANLVLNDLAKELSKAELGKNDKDLNYYKQFIKEQTWLKDSLIVDYQPEYNKIINPSTFTADKLNISQTLAIFYPETLSGEYIKNDCVANSQIVDKTWQTIRDKALELVSNATGDKEKLGIKIDIAFNNPNYTITLTYHPNSSITRDLDKLIISTPLINEIERLKKKTADLPTNENFNKVKKQNELWEKYLRELTNKENYQNVKEIINKIN